MYCIVNLQVVICDEGLDCLLQTMNAVLGEGMRQSWRNSEISSPYKGKLRLCAGMWEIYERNQVEGTYHEVVGENPIKESDEVWN